MKGYKSETQQKNIAWFLPRPKPDKYRDGMPLYAEEWLLDLAKTQNPSDFGAMPSFNKDLKVRSVALARPNHASLPIGTPDALGYKLFKRRRDAIGQFYNAQHDFVKLNIMPNSCVGLQSGEKL